MATEKDKVNVGLLGAITAVLALAVVGIAFAVTALVRNAQDEQVAEKSAEAERPAVELRQQQETELTSAAAWADKEKGTASVPIDRAMALVVDKIKANPDWATPAPPPPPEDAGAGDADAGDTDGGATDTDGGATDTDGGAAATTDAASPEAVPGDAGAPTPAAPEQPAPSATP